MTSLILKPGKIPEIIHVPSSKSYANRVLILYCLKNGIKKIKNIPNASDVTFLIDCLKKIGLKISQAGSEIIIKNNFPECEVDQSSLELDVGEGGTTARFLAAMLLLGKNEYFLKLGSRLKDRPWDEFIKVANSLGARVELRDNILCLKGPIRLNDDLEVDCSRTTQFASAFQMILMGKKSKVIPKNLNSSHTYFAMTNELINQIQKDDEYFVPLDWSSASYPLAFGALNQRIEFPGLEFDQFQSDAKFLSILESFGAIEINENGLIVKPIHIQKTLCCDVSDCLDLVPTLAFFLSHIPGEHELRGIKNLVHKESDRLNEVIKLLEKFNRKSKAFHDTLYISGSHEKILEPQKLIMPDDHRMVMVGSLFLRMHSGGEIDPPSAVAKSYPNFFDLLKDT